MAVRVTYGPIPSSPDASAYHRAVGWIDEGTKRTITTACGQTVVDDTGSEGGQSRLVELTGSDDKPNLPESYCPDCTAADKGKK